MVRWKVKRARKVWGIFKKTLRREGADIKVSEMFYRAVVQDGLLLDLELWVLLVSMEKIVEWAHTGFLRQIMGNWELQNTDGARVTLAAGELREVAEMKSTEIYIGCRQGMLAQWVDLHTLFKFYKRENDYERGGGHRSNPW